MTVTQEIAILCSALLISQRPYAFAQQAPPAASTSQAQGTLSPQQLDSLVAPIALYPDPILSQILVASTYPLEIVEAGRWLANNSNLKGQALADAAKKQTWDPSIQAMVMLPDVLTRLNQNITWTSNLGNAFLAQQDGVMEAIQRMRQKASASGALQSTPQQTVSTTTENGGNYIVIQPASPEVVYIPQYNPIAVWGPPDYYPYPSMYYPPYSAGAVAAASAISFGTGLALGAIWGGGGWGGWGWNAGWGSRNVYVNNNFINNNHFNRMNNIGNGNRWVHNPAHRAGVPYGNRGVASRFQSGARPATRPTAGQIQQSLGQRGGAGSANRLAQPGAGRGGMTNRMNPGNTGQRFGTGGPGQGGANRINPGNIGGGNRVSPGNIGGANRMANPNIGRGGGFNRGGGGFHGGGGGFRGGGGGFRGGGGGFRGGGGGFRGGGRRR